MNWIEKYKKWFIAVSSISVMTLLLFILFLRDKGTIENAEGWQIGVFVLPAVTFSASFLPLIYLSWFKKQQTGIIVVAHKLFFWSLTAAHLIIFYGIYSQFVFAF